MKLKCSASIMCADWMNMGGAVKELEEAKCDLIHCDVMDGHFVPNLMMPMDMINAIAASTDIPLDVHLMAEDPEYIINAMKLREGDIVSIHLESTYHVERLLVMLRNKGLRPFIALNPATPIESVIELLPELDGILIMTINPGFAAQKMVQFGPQKIARTRQFLDNHGYNYMEIEVDGNCNYPHIKDFKDAGANIFVLGTSSIYIKEMTVFEGLNNVRNILNGN